MGRGRAANAQQDLIPIVIRAGIVHAPIAVHVAGPKYQDAVPVPAGIRAIGRRGRKGEVHHLRCHTHGQGRSCHHPQVVPVPHCEVIILIRGHIEEDRRATVGRHHIPVTLQQCRCAGHHEVRLRRVPKLHHHPVHDGIVPAHRQNSGLYRSARAGADIAVTQSAVGLRGGQEARSAQPVRHRAGRSGARCATQQHLHRGVNTRQGCGDHAGFGDHRWVEVEVDVRLVGDHRSRQQPGHRLDPEAHEAMARGLMLRPHVILFDEPTAGLSPAYTQVVDQAHTLTELIDSARTIFHEDLESGDVAVLVEMKLLFLRVIYSKCTQSFVNQKAGLLK